MLNYVVVILLYGTLSAYIFNYVSSNYINLLKVDIVFAFSKSLLLLVLSLSFIVYTLFVYNYYVYYNNNSCYMVFSNYNIVPKVFQKFFFFFELSIDLFGIVILFLSYFVGILSLLALDTRIF